MCTMDRWDVLQWGIQRKLRSKAMNRAHLSSRWLRTIKLKPLSRWYGSSYYTWRVVHNTIACMELGWDHSYYFGYVANSCQCPSKQTAQMWWFHPPSDKWGKVQESLLPGLTDPPVSLCDGPRWACEPVAEGVPLSPPPPPPFSSVDMGVQSAPCGATTLVVRVSCTLTHSSMWLILSTG